MAIYLKLNEMNPIIVTQIISNVVDGIVAFDLYFSFTFFDMVSLNILKIHISKCLYYKNSLKINSYNVNFGNVSLLIVYSILIII